MDDRDLKTKLLRIEVSFKQGQLTANLKAQEFLLKQQIEVDEELRDLKAQLKELEQEEDSERMAHPLDE